MQGTSQKCYQTIINHHANRLLPVFRLWHLAADASFHSISANLLNDELTGNAWLPCDGFAQYVTVIARVFHSTWLLVRYKYIDCKWDDFLWQSNMEINVAAITPGMPSHQYWEVGNSNPWGRVGSGRGTGQPHFGKLGTLQIGAFCAQHSRVWLNDTKRVWVWRYHDVNTYLRLRYHT